MKAGRCVIKNMKWRFMMAAKSRSGRIISDRTNFGRIISGRIISGRIWVGLVLATLFVAIIGMDGSIIGHKPALACCYDPPEPVIEPDPVTAPDPGSDSQEEASPAPESTPESAPDSTPNAAEEKGESDVLPVNLYAPVLRTARLAIEDEQWLKAQEIISQARQRLGPAPEFSDILAEIDRHFGLSELASTSLLPENRAESGFVPVFEARGNPLEGLIEDFGANAELLRLP